MKRALITGSFDPPTLGHVDVIRRSASIFDEVVVCVCFNSQKQGMFTPDLRVEMLRASLTDLTNVTVERYDGLVADFALSHNIDVIVKGVRNATDYDYEAVLARVNLLNAPVESIFLPCDPAYQFVSSTVAREMIRYNRALDQLLPPAVIDIVRRESK